MIVVLGLSFRTAPVEVRERFATAADALPEVLARLSGRTELGEVMFLSTCNRVEVLASTPGRSNEERARALALKAIRDVLCEHAGVTDSELRQFLYEKHGEESVRHVFRVASSLDSMVLGEPQILGQVKSAYDAAMAAGTLKGYLGRCVHRAFTVAKRVRTETQIGAGLVSISSVAVDLAKRVFGDLSDRHVLLIGAGEMGEAAARSLGKGARSLRVCNRSPERGQMLARDVGGTYVPWSALESELVQADAVITAAASPTYVITLELAKRVMKARRGKTLLFVDIAVPRNVDPAVHKLDSVFAFDVDDLEQQVAVGLESRRAEAQAADRIVEEQVLKFLSWSRGLDVTPAIVALRTRTHATLASELERTLGGRLKHLSEDDRKALEQMIESAVNKILHVPTTRLRDAASSGDGADLVERLTELFDLPAAPSAADVGETDEDEEGDERIVQ
jgi:glutamyl-tRNA reductase